MQRRTFWITAGLALALTMPIAGATWYTRGSFEPDTEADIEAGMMWRKPDTSTDGGIRQIYFNAVPVDSNSASFNPNVGPLQSRYIPLGSMQFAAYLGIWKDCNEDGYIGAADGALFHYRTELLLGKTEICPDRTAHHGLGWVTEFIYISRNETGATSSRFPRVFSDLETRVWGDFGLPNDPRGVHYDCAQLPLPVGTLESTGGMLVYADCQIGYNVAKRIGTLDEDGSLGLRFEDQHHPERDCANPLNQGVPGGMYGGNPCSSDTGTFEATDDRMFTAYDCSQEGVAVRDPTAAPGQRGSLSQVYLPPLAAGYGGSTVNISNDEGTYRTVYAPSFSLGNPEGSLSASLDNAYSGTLLRCDQEASTVSNITYLESTFSATNPSDGKRMSDFDFGYTAQGYGPAGQASPPSFASTSDVPAWRASVEYLPPTYLGGTVRNDDLLPAPALYFTFYAKLGSNATGAGLKFPAAGGATRTYASEACSNIAPGASIENGWDCDPTHWWNVELGGTPNGRGMRPGDTYHLRDTDCYDGQLVKGVPVYASLALVSEDGVCDATPVTE